MWWYSRLMQSPRQAPFRLPSSRLRKQRAGFSYGKIVPFAVGKRAGTIIVNTRTNYLYYVLGNGTAGAVSDCLGQTGF